MDIESMSTEEKLNASIEAFQKLVSLNHINSIECCQLVSIIIVCLSNAIEDLNTSEEELNKVDPINK